MKQFDKASDLRVGVWPAVAVADETYPDGVLIELILLGAGGMRAGRLCQPAISDVEFTIALAGAVSNDKVIPKPVKASGFVLLSDCGG